MRTVRSLLTFPLVLGGLAVLGCYFAVTEWIPELWREWRDRPVRRVERA